MKYDVIIGIEIHCELKTETKLFSSSSTNFNAVANSSISPFDLALPGSLPRLNKKALDLALLSAKGLNMQINNIVTFDKKHYFYSDLPKGFQITQQENPLGTNGYIDINLGEITKKINIQRLHLEEDTARQIHEKDSTLIDYNRAGNPLIEIVSAPEIHTAEEAVNYVETLRLILLYLGVSDGKMEEGSLRCDINISLKEPSSKVFGTKVEIKNLNSLTNIANGINYEIKRQTKVLSGGNLVLEETRRYDEISKQTVVMRQKEEVDYKYSPETNLPPIEISDNYMEQLFENFPILPNELEKKYLKLGINLKDIKIILANLQLNEFLLQTLKLVSEPILISNFLLGDVLFYLNKNDLSLQETNLSPLQLSILINKQVAGEISSVHSKKIINDLLSSDATVEQLIKKYNFSQISDEEAIVAIIEKVISENEAAVTDYKNGRTNILGFLVGQVLKQSKGKANPNLTKELLLKKINN